MKKISQRQAAMKIIALMIIFISAFSCCSCSFNGYKLNARIFGGLTLSGLIFSNKADVIAGELTALLTDIDNSVNINGSQSDKSNDTVLVKLNKAKSGAEVELDIHAYTMLKNAHGFYEETQHLFNPAISPLVNLWGVNAYNLNNEYFPLPSIEQVREEMHNTDFSKLEVYERDSKYYAKKNADNMIFDLGAQAKGYAADEAVKIIRRYNPDGAHINLSGNVYVIGKYTDKNIRRNWIVTVRDPANILISHFAGFDLTDISVVTSGDNERFRYYSNNGTQFKVAHIINGTTGLPVNVEYSEQTNSYSNTVGLTSVTVFDVNSERADVYATTLMLLGMEKAIEFAETKGLDVLLIGADKRYAFVGNQNATAEDSDYLRTGYSAIAGYGIKKKQS